MIEKLAATFLQIGKNGEERPVAALDERLVSGASALAKDAHMDRLYEELKQLWSDHPGLDSAQVIDHLRKFAVDGKMPYKDIPTHTPALARLMQKLREEGAADSPIYAVLKQSLGFAVVSNGILNSFMTKMREPPQEPEAW
jgi:hypothetical protein